jgi:hypothetical protein
MVTELDMNALRTEALGLFARAKAANSGYTMTRTGDPVTAIDAVDVETLNQWLRSDGGVAGLPWVRAIALDYLHSLALEEMERAQIGALTHDQQFGYHVVRENDYDHSEALRCALTWKRSHVKTIWSDEEVIEILQDAAKVDKVTGRPLGHWEMMRLDQRDVIRSGIRR